MRVGFLVSILLIAGCSVFHQPSYQEKLGWAHEHGLSIEGAVSESDGWRVRLKLNDRCSGLLTFESKDDRDPGGYILRIVPTGSSDVLETIEEAKISIFAADFKLGNVTTTVKEACIS